MCRASAARLRSVSGNRIADDRREAIREVNHLGPDQGGAIDQQMVFSTEPHMLHRSTRMMNPQVAPCASFRAEVRIRHPLGLEQSFVLGVADVAKQFFRDIRYKCNTAIRVDT